MTKTDELRMSDRDIGICPNCGRLLHVEHDFHPEFVTMADINKRWQCRPVTA